MTRFDYLQTPKKKAKARKKADRAARRALSRRPSPDLSSGGPVPAGPADAVPGTVTTAGDALVTVYVRRETVRAVWREVKQGGGESVSELVEDLLLAWLRDRTR